MRLKPCNLHFTVAYWRGIQPNHKAVPAIQNIVRSYVTIISTHSSLIKGIIHVEGSGKPRHEWVPVLGDFLRKRVVKIPTGVLRRQKIPEKLRRNSKMIASRGGGGFGINS